MINSVHVRSLGELTVNDIGVVEFRVCGVRGVFAGFL